MRMTLDLLALDHDDSIDLAVTRYAQDVRDLLGLHEWGISLKFVDVITDDSDDGRDPEYGEHTAICSYREPYQIATIKLLRGRDLADYYESVMHELLHLAVAPLDRAAQQVAGFLKDRHRDAALDIISDGVERTVTRLAKALVKGIRPPAEPSDDAHDADTYNVESHDKNDA
jgi:hypothetical protein